MECPRCQTEKAQGAKYCGGCGRPVQLLQLLSCQHCGTGNPPTDKFCHECGRALAGQHASSRETRPTTPSLEDTEEIHDSAFWEAYADRTGIPEAGLIEVAPGPVGALRDTPVEDRDSRRSFRRGRERGLYATLQEDRERRRPVRIVVAAGTILAVVLILLVLSTTSWHAVLGPVRQDVSVAPSDQPTVASGPVSDPVPAPAAPAPPPSPLVEDSPAPADEIRVLPSPQARSGALDTPVEPSRSPTAPNASAERMAAFLIGRDGPERAIQTALAVATFYPVSSADFIYWHRVVAAIRASTAPKDAAGGAGSDASTDKTLRH